MTRSWYDLEHHDIEIMMMLVSKNSIQCRDAPSQPQTTAGPGAGGALAGTVTVGGAGTEPEPRRLVSRSDRV